MTDDFIPVANPKLSFLKHREQILEAFERVLSSGWYILGDEVRNFENEFAAFLGAGHCIGVASGTDAIAIALKAVGVSRDDEVITVSHSAVATVAAIEQIGAVAVFVDIDEATRCIDPDKIKPAVSDRTKAIVPVHIYGQPAPMNRILAIARQNNLKVVEDCAQAHGAEINGQKVGTFGDAAAFSFYPTKNLGAIGDGGAIATCFPEIAERATWLRQYGWKDRYISSMAGLNSRLDEIQAAVLRSQLPFLSENNDRRRQIAERYFAAIDGAKIVAPTKIKDTLSAMHLFVVQCQDRDNLQKFLKDEGIGTAIHYPEPIHQQPAYSGRVKGCHDLPCTERLYQNILSLPMYPELTDSQVEKISTTLIDWGQI